MLEKKYKKIGYYKNPKITPFPSTRLITSYMRKGKDGQQ